MTRTTRCSVVLSVALTLGSLASTTATADAFFRKATLSAMRVDARYTPATLWVTFDRNDGTGKQTCVGSASTTNIDNAAVALLASVTRREFTRNKVFVTCSSRANGATLLGATYNPNLPN